ncbi:13878_t:CDS:2 [Funneliformis geosporum]|uniref:4866_t:CDS:1 n=1 Tax=Funneliformis geosporum TaxID=1117311 RepID=A0A9W4X319_9GLOM|nr:4866_t:CDS:2 [Funneliformis geosporum]CAI2192038.1 13878_t:CDS:2 [Funneliformis geosporum]
MNLTVFKKKISFKNYSLEYQPNLKKLNKEKRKFLKEFSSIYGYDGKINQIREKEYPQLKSCAYLDHTGSTTFAKSSLTEFVNDITNNLYGNPHSNSPSSQASTERIKKVRTKILEHFDANERDYAIIFTQNATASIKLVGEIFPWTNKSSYRYLRESHSSINGLRRFPEQLNAVIEAVTEYDVDSMINENTSIDFLDMDEEEITYNLFAYPAQCNFSGMKFPLSWTSGIKKFDTEYSKTLVLLDAAAYVPTSSLSLANKETSPDFVVLSFYKMFGFPTGLGALILKTELNQILRKAYFGGGTLKASVYDRQWQQFRDDLTERYEDGTVNFLNIIALDYAFDSMERLYKNYEYISNHVTSLITYLSRTMKSFCHYNGQAVCIVNSDRDFSDNKQQGATFSFNLKRSDGKLVGYLEVEKLASVNGIHIRSGGNCNPGSVSKWMGITSDEFMQNYMCGKVCDDNQDIFHGKSYGAVRLSIGAMTTIEDILIWLDFFERNYVETSPDTNFL